MPIKTIDIDAVEYQSKRHRMAEDMEEFQDAIEKLPKLAAGKALEITLPHSAKPGYKHIRITFTRALRKEMAKLEMREPEYRIATRADKVHNAIIIYVMRNPKRR